MFVRIATPEDAKAIVSILVSIGWLDDINNNPESTEKLINDHLQKSILSDKNVTSVFVVIKDGVIVGYATLYWMTYYTSYPFDELEGYISEFYIHNEFQNKGIGSYLLDELKKIARSKGCSKLTLISVKNRQSYTFYKNKKWEERPDLIEFDCPLEK